MPQVAEALSGDLAKVGIKTTVNVQSIGDWITEFLGPRNKVGGIFVGEAGVSLSPDPDFNYEFNLPSNKAVTGGTNSADYVNPQVDKLILAEQATNDKAKRFATFSKLMQIVANDVPVIPISSINVAMAISHNFRWKNFSNFTEENANYLLQVSAAKG
jgi:ABC-type transport system substrate-binding protein